MPAITPYAKTLSGQSEKVLIGTTAGAYTAQTTFPNFVNSAAVLDGEIGVFDGATSALVTIALVAGQTFFLAQKRDGAVQRTPVIAWNNLQTKIRTGYVAPVPKIVSIGYNTTNTTSSILFNFTAAALTNTLTFGIAVRDTTPGNQPFPVQEGYASVQSTTANQYSVLSSIVQQINAELDYEREYPDKFVYGEIQTNATGTTPTVAATVSVTNGSNQIVFNAAPTGAPAVGGYILLLGVLYKIVAIAADNVTYTLDRLYQGVTNTTLAVASAQTAAYTDGTSLLGVRFTGLTSIGGIFSNPSFIVAGSLNLQTSPVLTTQQFLLGSGYGASIVELESRQAAIFDGVGSTINAAFASDYGQPTKYALAANTYDQFFLTFISSPTGQGGNPIDPATPQFERIHICAVASTTLDSSLKTILTLP